ncbi:MAG: hypothetical protein ABW173_10565 [Sphingomonas sp.]
MELFPRGRGQVRRGDRAGDAAARRGVEIRQTPDELLPAVAGLQLPFDRTLAISDPETDSLADRRPVPARRTTA